MATLNGNTPQAIAKEIMQDLPTDRINALATELNISYEKANSLIKAEQRAKEYRKKQQELMKEARKSPSWKKIFENCDSF